MTQSTPPRISLVTPNYNGEKFLDTTVKSVIEQNYQNLDYVLVDGLSTDRSASIMELYRNNVSKIIIEADDGHADALNKGFAHTDGNIMGWINSDDVLLPGSLAIVARIFELYPEVEWITGLPSTCDESGNLTYVGPLKPWSQARFLCGDHLWIQQESTFWRRSLWERAGGLDTHWKVANDFDLWARFFRHASLHSVDTLLGCFRVRTGQRSIQHRALYMREVDQILTRELNELAPVKRKAYENLLPNKPTFLDSAERKALEPALRKMDPPFITLAQLRSDTPTLFNPVSIGNYEIEAAPVQSSSLKDTLMRNWRYALGMMIVGICVVAAATYWPDSRVWLAAGLGTGSALSVSIALALKTRRIINALIQSIKLIERSAAREAYQRHMMELELMNIKPTPNTNNNKKPLS
ncbi:glycosyltransferase family 2 protein [Oceanicaulis sp. HTCC2633]|uniref:glycosyltransferase family 2 protein n=1 Tax=Oceanicaulis sp. HTCC2633 TaxID=314254 RepID=UPI00031E4C86|nr:glycosyltransferase family 2 protein [Oceanicaulis sp. HTCC2633]